MSKKLTSDCLHYTWCRPAEVIYDNLREERNQFPKLILRQPWAKRWGVGRAHGLFTAVGSSGSLPPDWSNYSKAAGQASSKPPSQLLRDFSRCDIVTRLTGRLWQHQRKRPTWLFTHLFTRWRPLSVRSVHKHVIQVFSPVWLVPHWLHCCTATAQRALGSAEWSTESKVRPSWQQLPGSCQCSQGPSWARSMWLKPRQP